MADYDPVILAKSYWEECCRDLFDYFMKCDDTAIKELPHSDLTVEMDGRPHANIPTHWHPSAFHNHGPPITGPWMDLTYILDNTTRSHILVGAFFVGLSASSHKEEDIPSVLIKLTSRLSERHGERKFYQQYGRMSRVYGHYMEGIMCLWSCNVQLNRDTKHTTRVQYLVRWKGLDIGGGFYISPGEIDERRLLGAPPTLQQRCQVYQRRCKTDIREIYIYMDR